MTEHRLPNPIAKWVMEQNALYVSERSSEAEGPGSTSSIADTDGRVSSPVPSFTTTSSRHTKSSYERHRTGSPPLRDVSSRHEGHSTSPFDTLESAEVQTMSDSASKFSDYSAEPEYHPPPPPKSAPPVTVVPQMSYKDAFNDNSLHSQQMSSSLTPYSQQNMTSQPGQLDKLSTDVMYHTPQSGASLPGISSIMPRLLHGRDGKPYLGRVHLKELDGDEIDLVKQRIKLMFYEKKHEETLLREEEEETHSPSPGSSRKVHRPSPPSSPPNTHQFQSLTEDQTRNAFLDGDVQLPEVTDPLHELETCRVSMKTAPRARNTHQFQSLDEDQSRNAFSDDEAQLPGVRDLLHELETQQDLAFDQKTRCKKLKFAREKEGLDLQRAEVEYQEQELMEHAVASKNTAQWDKWQKDQKRRMRQLERYRTEQKEKMQMIEAEEHRAEVKLKDYEASIRDLNRQLDALVASDRRPSSSAAAIVESHLQPYSQHAVSERIFTRTGSGCSPGFAGDLRLRNEQGFRPVPDSDQPMLPEREWPQDSAVHSKPTPGHFVSMDSINSSSLPCANEPPEFSREIVNTISESTNMTEMTQDDPVPSRNWAKKYVPNSDDPYAYEFSKYSYSDDEFFMDNRMKRDAPDVPVDARQFESSSERDVQRSPYDSHSPRLLNGHSPSYRSHENNDGFAVLVDQLPDDEKDGGRSRPPQRRGRRSPPPPLSEKPLNYTSGRTGHHYSRSNRPRMHNRHQSQYVNDNLSTASGTTTAVSTPDVVPAFSPSSFSKVPSPGSIKPLQQMAGMTGHVPAPQSLSYQAPSSYSPYREPLLPPSTTHTLYSVPSSTSSALVYDVPRKGATKPTAAIYDHPRPTPSPQNHVTPSNPTSPQPPSSSSSSSYNPPVDSHAHARSPLYNAKPHEQSYNSHEQQQQLYDVPKPQASEPSRATSAMTSSAADRDVSRHTAPNTSSHPYQYHGLSTKLPAPRSYSRGRQEVAGYGSDKGFKGQGSRPRVQRQQTEL